MEKEDLSYTISEKDYDKKIYPYLKKFSTVMKSELNEFYNINNEIITRERKVTHYLYNKNQVRAFLDNNKNMIVALPSIKDRKLLRKLEKLAIR
jgi:hypothetical protein